MKGKLMNHRAGVIFTICALLSYTAHATTTDPTVTFTGSTPSTTPVIINNGDGTYNVTIFADPTIAETDVDVGGDFSTCIRELVFDYSALNATQTRTRFNAFIAGSAPGSPLGTINYISVAGDFTGLVDIELLVIAGDLGPAPSTFLNPTVLNAHEIRDVTITGDLYGKIVSGRVIENFTAQGSFIADSTLRGSPPTAPGSLDQGIVVNNSVVTPRITNLELFGDFGEPSAPMTIEVQEINELEVDELHAVIKPQVNKSLVVRRIVTAGNVTGTASGIGTAPLRPDGTPTALSDELFVIGGNAFGSIDFGGQTVGGVFNTGVINRPLKVTGTVTNTIETETLTRTATTNGFIDIDGEVNPFATGTALIDIEEIVGDAYVEVASNLAGLIDIAEVVDDSGDPAAVPSLTIGGSVLGLQAGQATPLRINVSDDWDGFLDVTGDFDGDAIFGGDVTSTTTIGLDAGGALVIAGSLSGDLDFGSISGQVVVNADGFGSDTWTSTSAVVNGVTLTRLPHYPELPSDIGGGAIGLVPFSIHREACVPVHDSTVNETCAATMKPGPCDVQIRFYGPVTGPTTPGGSFLVECRPIGTTLPWDDISSDFEAAFSADCRTVTLAPVASPSACWANGHIFRVTPKAALVCKDVPHSVSADPSRKYVFIVEQNACAAADMYTTSNCSAGPDGIVDLSDFSCYLSDYSVSDPKADITGNGTCDLATSGDGVTLSDFSCYLSLWSNGCP